MKRIICIFMAVLLLGASSCGPAEKPSIATKPPATNVSPTEPTRAQDETERTEESESESETEEESTEVRPTIPVINPDGRMMDDPGVGVDSETYCVIDDRMQIVTGKDEFKRMAPASLTKVMTLLLVCERANMNDVVEVSEKAVNSVDIISSGVYPSLKPKEKFTVEQLLYMLMIPSTNAAGNVLAEYVSGSEEAFAIQMNNRLSSLGLTHSHFENAHGLDRNNHYSCAFDMAVILKEALKNDTARKIMGTVQYTVPATEYTKEREMVSTNSLINGAVSCPGVFASKTGGTIDAGATIVAACERSGITLYCCTMKAATGNHFYDAVNLLDASFSFLTGKSGARYGFLKDLRFASADEDRIQLCASAVNDIASIKAVYWPESLGTGAAKTVEGIEPSEDMSIVLNMGEIGDYVVQLFVKDAWGHEHVDTQSLLFSGASPWHGFGQWYEYVIYVDENGFTPNGVFETKNGAYYMNRGKTCSGFVGSYFFAGEDGKIVRGWFESSNTRYYAGADGRVVTGKCIVDGRLYSFGEHGALED